ncbi:hypothetical protein BU15DRAFT_68714 [Melanogaster broomeanus]|nr:hypothetical protein BU15DRAFT_68714 [Melanogaster broomeanus]
MQSRTTRLCIPGESWPDDARARLKADPDCRHSIALARHSFQLSSRPSDRFVTIPLDSQQSADFHHEITSNTCKLQKDASSKSSQPTGSPKKSNHVELVQTLQIHCARVWLAETRCFLGHLPRVNISATSDMRLLWTSDDPRVKFGLRTFFGGRSDATAHGQPRRSGCQVFAPTYAMRSVDDVEKDTSDGRIVALGLPLSLKHSVYYDQGTVRFARDRFTQTLVARATLGTEANQIWISWIDSMSWLTLVNDDCDNDSVSRSFTKDRKAYKNCPIRAKFCPLHSNSCRPCDSGRIGKSDLDVLDRPAVMTNLGEWCLSASCISTVNDGIQGLACGDEPTVILRATVLVDTAMPACLFLRGAHKSVSERDLLRLSAESLKSIIRLCDREIWGGYIYCGSPFDRILISGCSSRPAEAGPSSNEPLCWTGGPSGMAGVSQGDQRLGPLLQRLGPLSARSATGPFVSWRDRRLGPWVSRRYQRLGPWAIWRDPRLGTWLVETSDWVHQLVSEIGDRPPAESATSGLGLGVGSIGDWAISYIVTKNQSYNVIVSDDMCCAMRFNASNWQWIIAARLAVNEVPNSKSTGTGGASDSLEEDWDNREKSEGTGGMSKSSGDGEEVDKSVKLAGGTGISTSIESGLLKSSCAALILCQATIGDELGMPAKVTRRGVRLSRFLVMEDFMVPMAESIGFDNYCSELQQFTTPEKSSSTSPVTSSNMQSTTQQSPQAVIDHETEVIKTALTKLSVRDVQIWTGVCKEIYDAVTTISKIASPAVIVPPLAIAATLELEYVQLVTKRLKAGKWPSWASIKESNDAIKAHPWYVFGCSPEVPTDFTLHLTPMVATAPAGYKGKGKEREIVEVEMVTDVEMVTKKRAEAESSSKARAMKNDADRMDVDTPGTSKPERAAATTTKTPHQAQSSRRSKVIKSSEWVATDEDISSDNQKSRGRPMSRQNDLRCETGHKPVPTGPPSDHL